MYLSNSVKALLAELGDADNRTDEEIPAGEGQEKREPIAIVPRDVWYEHVVPVRGRRLARSRRRGPGASRRSAS
ncbi:hypothetical protein [Streptomyces sp. PTD5-9]|uniref:hypothetical protein n=1 Tax=Streptomyces sp. PTD5-9 TaxID=3120150 RepID=UPI00300A2896